MLLAAGLLNYGSPAVAGPTASDPASPAASEPPPGAYVPPSLPPVDSTFVPPSPTPTPDPDRVATRIVIASLDIDLPIIKQPDPDYPACNVAMEFEHPKLGQPGDGRSVYLYAHAQVGMFYPLYERVTLGRHGGADSLIGLRVDVYTSDDEVHHYDITRIRPRVKADGHFLDSALSVKREFLWLQTSTGPGASFPKLQVIAEPVFTEPAKHADAHPRPHPVDCQH
jgi:hypothetical protein